jgi:hypothetical protein
LNDIEKIENDVGKGKGGGGIKAEIAFMWHSFIRNLEIPRANICRLSNYLYMYVILIKKFN